MLLYVFLLISHYIPCLFFCLLVIIYMFLFNILFIGHYLHASFYSSVFQSSAFPVSSSDYQSLSTCSFMFFFLSVIYIPCLFFCLLVIIYMFLFNILFIGHCLHASFCSSVFQSSTFPVSSSDYHSLSTCSFMFFCLSVIYIPCFL